VTFTTEVALPETSSLRGLAALLAGTDVISRLDGDSPLAQSAHPVLDQLALDLTGTSVDVVLANEQGHVVDRRVSEPRLIARLVFAEYAVGNNGIGTALEQRKPAVVEGEEPVADALVTAACAAVPISDPRTGSTLGVIALMSMPGDPSALMLPLAMRVARDIEHRLVDGAKVSEQLTLQRFLQERRRAKGPLVFITDTTMLTNAAADRLISAGDESLLREWVAGPRSATPDETSRLVLSGGTTVTVRCEPLLDGGTQVGYMLRLKIADAASGRTQGRDSRPTFGWASLTDTERSVIELVATGHTNREAAERLYLSHHTVGFHLRSIFAKLGVNSRVDLTRIAIEHEMEHSPTHPDLVAS
jgi:DNA-binding CsgD family transcriptional regulator